MVTATATAMQITEQDKREQMSLLLRNSTPNRAGWISGFLNKVSRPPDARCSVGEFWFDEAQAAQALLEMGMAEF
jgi:hypothetical protein